MSSTPSEDTPVRHPFERRVDNVKPSKTDINAIIMDYLINEGYPDAADKFRTEANIKQYGGTDMIQQRVDIRNCIVKGDIQGGIEKINNLSPELLDNDVPLHFKLLRLQLIELIKSCLQSSPSADITPAIEFATTHLAPIAPTHPTFLRDLEYTMALLIFPKENRSETLNALLDPTLRQEVATRVNEALLESQGHARRARLKSLVRLRAWAESEARWHDSVKKGLPEEIELWPDVWEPANDSSNNGGGGGMDTSEDTPMAGNGGAGGGGRVEYVAI